MNIDGIAAVVTGGASGLGSASAAMLAAQGAKVTLFDLNEEKDAAVAREIAGRFVQVDVADEGSVARALTAAEEAHGIARILVTCAGIAPAIKTVGKDNMPHPLDLYRRTIEVNLIGTFNVIAQFAARLALADPVGEERGVIVNTASLAAFDGQIGQAAYAAFKSGIVCMTLPIARDLAQHRIRVMTIAPGIFLTPILLAFPKSSKTHLAPKCPTRAGWASQRNTRNSLRRLSAIPC